MGISFILQQKWKSRYVKVRGLPLHATTLQVRFDWDE